MMPVVRKIKKNYTDMLDVDSIKRIVMNDADRRADAIDAIVSRYRKILESVSKKREDKSVGAHFKRVIDAYDDKKLFEFATEDMNKRQIYATKELMRRAGEAASGQ